MSYNLFCISFQPGLYILLPILVLRRSSILSLCQSPRKYTCYQQPAQVSLFCLKSEPRGPSACGCKQVSSLPHCCCILKLCPSTSGAVGSLCKVFSHSSFFLGLFLKVSPFLPGSSLFPSSYDQEKSSIQECRWERQCVMWTPHRIMSLDVFQFSNKIFHSCKFSLLFLVTCSRVM